MVEQAAKSPDRQVVDMYRGLVTAKHGGMSEAWPVVSGYNVKIGGFGGWLIIIYTHTGNSNMTSLSGIGELSRALTGVDSIDARNRLAVKKRLEAHFGLKPSDAICLVAPDGQLGDELQQMLQRHEFAKGLVPMKIFLSHKGADKPLIREYMKTLQLLGFDPWLDEDAMKAGVELERGLLQGFKDSCAAVFFITPNYKDENYLATEIDYAIKEKREKGDRFAIITLVLSSEGQVGAVPEMLHRYVWKEPKNDLETMREITKALPIQSGDVYWKE